MRQDVSYFIAHDDVSVHDTRNMIFGINKAYYQRIEGIDVECPEGKRRISTQQISDMSECNGTDQNSLNKSAIGVATVYATAIHGFQPAI